LIPSVFHSASPNHGIHHQIFMYNNEADLRDLFVFLVKALLKEKMEIADDGLKVGY
jgi:hypothetical protein